MITDSGERRQFESGAVRDIANGKGRCDLLPLGVLSDYLNDTILHEIDMYIYTGDILNIHNAISLFSDEIYKDPITPMLEVAKHFEEGANKYAERNWEQGIPLHCYIDSAVRHYLKFRRGDSDELHDRAFLWNLLCALWTQERKPELIDLPFKENN